MPKTSRDVRLLVWRVPAYLPYLQPPLTKRVVRATEAALKVVLPRAYLDILEVQNGGYLRRPLPPSDWPPVSFIAGLGPRFPHLPMRDWAEEKEYMADQGLKIPRRIDDLIPFSGDGHYYYCFDYRKSGRRAEPRVSYVDVETFNTDEVVAPDFPSFVKRLGSHHGTAVALHTRGDIKKVARDLSVATGRKFVVQDQQLYGYPQFRAALPGSNSLWLSPNRVSKGFVRKSEPDFAKLRDLLPGETDRFPQHQDCDYFLTTSSDVPLAKNTALLEKLDRLSFKVSVVDLDE